MRPTCKPAQPDVADAGAQRIDDRARRPRAAPSAATAPSARRPVSSTKSRSAPAVDAALHDDLVAHEPERHGVQHVAVVAVDLERHAACRTSGGTGFPRATRPLSRCDPCSGAGSRSSRTRWRPLRTGASARRWSRRCGGTRLRGARSRERGLRLARAPRRAGCAPRARGRGRDAPRGRLRVEGQAVAIACFRFLEQPRRPERVAVERDALRGSAERRPGVAALLRSARSKSATRKARLDDAREGAHIAGPAARTPSRARTRRSPHRTGHSPNEQIARAAAESRRRQDSEGASAMSHSGSAIADAIPARNRTAALHATSRRGPGRAAADVGSNPQYAPITPVRQARRSGPCAEATRRAVSTAVLKWLSAGRGRKLRSI